MANKKKFNITLSEGDYQDLKRLVNARGDELATRAAYFVQRAIDDAREKGEIPAADLEAETDIAKSLNQIREYLRLLSGDRTERNGISFVVIGQILDLSPETLNDLYKLVLDCQRKLKIHEK